MGGFHRSTLFPRSHNLRSTLFTYQVMKVVVIGTRGIPNIQGGVETHCEELYPRIVKLGADVTIIRRTCHIPENDNYTEYKGVKLVDVYAPKRKSLEAIVHSVLATFKAKRLGADIVHIHAIGPSLCCPLARLLGMKVVSTNHGPDYDRQKWGTLAKTMLRIGEWCQAHFANHIISISNVITQILSYNYNRTTRVSLIYNGVNIPEKSTSTDYLSSLNLEPGKYVFALARFVPEKRFDLLIKAFQASHHSGYKLVLAGDADHENDFSRALKAQAKDAGVVLTGFVKGEKLNQLFTNARLFVLPSTHEGLPISLLEAMSYSIDVLVSDIPANQLEELTEADFFHVDDMAHLTAKLNEKLSAPHRNRQYDLSRFNWDHIAQQTLSVYEECLKK